MKFVDLKQHMKNGAYKPCYLITGDDAFVVKSAVDRFRMLAGVMPELNTSVFEKNFLIADLISALWTPPMMADYRIVRVNDLTQEYLEINEYLQSPNPSAILLFVGEVTPAFKKVMDKIEIIDCNKLDKGFIEKWLVMKATQEKTSFTPDAVSLLVDYCNRDMSKIFMELDKLVVYSEGKPITVEMVEELVRPDLEYKLFELSNALADKSADKTMTILQTLLDASEPIVKLLGMLYSHFRRLLFVSLNPQSDTLSSDLGIKEFAVNQMIKQSKKYNARRLKVICDKLHAIDFDFKRGAINDKTALFTFICDVLLRG